MKEKFKQWMVDVEKKSPVTADNYSRSIDKISKHYSEHTGNSLNVYKLDISKKANVDLLIRIERSYSLNGKYSDFGKYGNGSIRNSIATYTRFVSDLNAEHKLEKHKEAYLDGDIQAFLNSITVDPNKREKWINHLMDFHKRWKFYPTLLLNPGNKYIWNKKISLDPDSKIQDVFHSVVDKGIIDFFKMEGKTIIRDIEESDLIQIIYRRDLELDNFKRIIDTFFYKPDLPKPAITLEKEPYKTIDIIKKNLNDFKELIDSYESTIHDLTETISLKDKKISEQANTIIRLEDELNRKGQALDELENIKGNLTEVKKLLCKDIAL